MAPRLIANLIYVTVILLGVAWLYHSVTAFQGEMIIPLKRSETMAIRPATGTFNLTALQRKVPAELLLLDNPASIRMLDEKLNYDGAQLPLQVRVDSIEVLAERPDKEVFILTTGEVKENKLVEKEYEIEEGTEIIIEDHRLVVGARTPWKGLVFSSQGSPMATVALHSRETKSWSQPLLLQPGQWTILGDDAALLFRWHDSEEAIKSSSVELEKIARPRWGIRDDKVTHWFTQFSPGTGATRNDDAQVTLLAVAPKDSQQPEKILVGIEIDEVEEQVTLKAGELSPEIRFENPGAAKNIYIIDAWKNELARVSIYRERRQLSQLRMGTQYKDQYSGGRGIRLMEIMQHALPVTQSGDTIWQREFTLDGIPYYVREGNHFTPLSGAVDFRYRRIPQGPVTAVTLTLTNQDTREITTINLSGTGSHRVGQWRFQLNPDNPNARRSTVLKVERVLLTPGQAVGLGILVLVLYGWTGLRHFGRKKRVPRHGSSH